MLENVLIITIDSLRFDHCPLPEGGTPNIEAIRTDTVAFEHAFTTGPGTTCSFPGILTGTLPLSYDGLGPLNPDRPRLAEYSHEAGFATGGFQTNPFLSNHFNYDVGFKTFVDYQNPLMGIATKVFPRGIEINNPKLERLDRHLHLTDAIKKTYQLVRGKPRPYVSAEVITEDTIEWLQNVDSPFFCWTHYMDVHHPCFPPEQYREKFGVADVTQSDVSEWYSIVLSEPTSLTNNHLDQLRGLYRSAIAYTVAQIGRILRQLEETCRYDETLIILTSDHGELFGEHGQYGKPERMYDELLRVPFVVVNGPDYLADATDDLVSLLDIPPIIHNALGLEIPDEYEGRIPGKDEERNFIMAEHEIEGNVIVGARSENWLYEADEINNEHRLFDVRDGGFERVDRSNPEATTVRDAVLTRLEELDIEAKYLQGNVKADIEDRLEDLGYL